MGVWLPVALSLAGCGPVVVPESGPDPPAQPTVGVLDCPETLSIRQHADDGRFGNDWSAANGLVAFNREAADGYQNLYVAAPDGTGELALTEGNPAVPGRHACSPVWSPDGEYLYFSAEKAEHEGSSVDAFCGFGAASDVWVMRADGSDAHALTDLPGDLDHGAMIPRVSPDGTALLWTQRTAAPQLLDPARAFGSWVLEVGTLSGDGAERTVTDVREYQPGDEGFYEGADFMPDGTGILYSSGAPTDNAWEAQVLRLDLGTGVATQLTSGAYNEHPRYTRDGAHIVWMSSAGAELHGTDWWGMDADGGEPERLTWFEDPDNAQSAGAPVYPGPPTWDPDGLWFIGDVETSLLSQDYTSVEVSCAAT